MLVARYFGLVFLANTENRTGETMASLILNKAPRRINRPIWPMGIYCIGKRTSREPPITNKPIDILKTLPLYQYDQSIAMAMQVNNSKNESKEVMDRPT